MYLHEPTQICAHMHMCAVAYASAYVSLHVFSHTHMESCVLHSRTHTPSFLGKAAAVYNWKAEVLSLLMVAGRTGL